MAPQQSGRNKAPSLARIRYTLWRLSLSVSADNVTSHAPQHHGPPCGVSVQPPHARPTRSGDLGPPPPPTRRPPAGRASTASAQSSRPTTGFGISSNAPGT